MEYIRVPFEFKLLLKFKLSDMSSSDIDSEFDKMYQDEDQYDIVPDRQKLNLSADEEAKDEVTKRAKLSDH